MPKGFKVELPPPTPEEIARKHGRKRGLRGAAVIIGNTAIRLFNGDFPQGDIELGELHYVRGKRVVSVTVGGVTSSQMLVVPENMPIEHFLDAFKDAATELQSQLAAK